MGSVGSQRARGIAVIHVAHDPYWRGRSVFVTGCTGLLGSWLSGELLAAGAEVVGLIRDWVPDSRLIQEGLIDRIKTVRGDVLDLDLLDRVINEYEVEVVFHLAAQTIVGTASRSPRGTFETNIRGTWNLLEACRRLPRPPNVVVASSDKAYGDQATLPYEEDAPLLGSFPYDVSKSCADLIARAYYVSYGLPVAITRCGNFFGGGDLNFNRLVPGTIRSALRGERPVIRSDGTYLRDYLYVRDGALAYMHLARSMASQPIAGEAFNFSNEVRIIVIDLVRRLLTLMDRTDLEPLILNSSKNEIPAQYLSGKKSRERLGWSPRYGFDESLLETIEWYRNYFTERAA